MDILQSVGMMFGTSWASGVNLYMTAGALGIFERLHWISLPGDMKILAHPLIILVAIVLYVIEFVADKIPVIDNLWDSAHTLIRPAAGAAMGFLAVSHLGPVAQTLTGMVTGGITASSHLTKATSRLAVNTTTIPGTNIVVSVAEDASVGGMLYLILKHPIIAGLVVIAFVIFAIWFLRKMFHLLKKVLFFFFRKNDSPAAAATKTT